MNLMREYDDIIRNVIFIFNRLKIVADRSSVVSRKKFFIVVVFRKFFTDQFLVVVFRKFFIHKKLLVIVRKYFKNNMLVLNFFNNY